MDALATVSKGMQKRAPLGNLPASLAAPNLKQDDDYEIKDTEFTDAGDAIDIWTFSMNLAREGFTPDSASCKRILEQGQVLNRAIKQARADKKKAVSFKYKNTAANDVVIRIELPDPNDNRVLPGMVTRNRFMAFVHICNYVNQYGHKSALAARIDWSKVDSLYASPMQMLAGAGFQFIGKPIRDNRFGFANNMIQYGIYWVTAQIMDYLSISGTIYKSAELRNEFGAFGLLDYIKNPTYFLDRIPGGQQSVVDAACRNLGLKGLQDIPEEASGAMKEYIMNIHIAVQSNIKSRRAGNDELLNRVVQSAIDDMIAMEEQTGRQSLGTPIIPRGGPSTSTAGTFAPQDFKALAIFDSPKRRKVEVDSGKKKEKTAKLNRGAVKSKIADLLKGVSKRPDDDKMVEILIKEFSVKPNDKIARNVLSDIVTAELDEHYMLIEEDSETSSTIDQI